MKNILFPTDFSENSKNAIRYTLDFFKGSQCSFYFLNVQKSSEFIMDDVLSADPETSVHEAILSDNKQQLLKFMDPLKIQYKDEAFEFLPYVDFDNLTDSVKQLMQAQPIDLIAMGTNGATGAQEVLFGSNTLHMIRNVDCPLLVIPEGYTYKKLDAVLFTASSCKDISHDNATPLKAILKLKNSKLHILKIKENIQTPAHECAACMVSTLNGLDHEMFSLCGIAAPVAVDAFVQLIPVGMHAMFVERETFLERFFFGNNTAKISHGTRIPLLILHK